MRWKFSYYVVQRQRRASEPSRAEPSLFARSPCPSLPLGPINHTPLDSLRKPGDDATTEQAPVPVRREISAEMREKLGGKTAQTLRRSAERARRGKQFSEASPNGVVCEKNGRLVTEMASKGRWGGRWVFTS